MSLRTFSVGFLSIKPKIWIENDQLFARSSFWTQLFSLFGFYRFVCVDKKQKTIDIYRRKFWVMASSQVIRFDEVHYIDYDCSTLGTSWGGLATGYERQDQLESFNVALVLKSDQKVPLFSFLGEGSVETGWMGVLLGGDSVIDLEGNQGEASRVFVNALEKFIGVSIGLPMKQLTDKEGNKYFCKACNRPSAPQRKKCMYCGGEIYSPDKPEDVRRKTKKQSYCPRCKRYFTTVRSTCIYCTGPMQTVETEE